MTMYTVLQEVEHDGDRASTWDDIGEFEASTPRAAAVAAVSQMSAADQAKAKTTRFRVAAASAFVELPAPGVETTTKVSFA